MKVNFRSWRWSLPVAALLVCGSPWAVAQQPSIVEVQPEPLGPADEDAPPVPTDVEQAPASQVPANELPTDAGSANPAADDQAQDAPEPAAGPAAELIQERFKSGKIKIEREMIQDAAGNYVLHGSWKEFDEQGTLIVEGQYAHNQKDGLWRRQYRSQDVPLLSTAPYKDFTGPFVSQATFKHGALDGKWTMVDSKQRKIHEIDFQAGERHGVAAYFYPSGSVLLQAPFEHGLVTGDVLDYAPDGAVVRKEHFEAGRKLSQTVEHHDAKKQVKKAETMILHAVLVAKSPDNWETATLAVFEARGQDEKHGPFATWHANGQPAKQGEFRYNLPVGKFVFWYANGQKQMEGTYVDGQQQGPWAWWHENGQKSIGGDYKDGQPIGAWSWWKSTGKLAQRTDFAGGKPIVPTPIPDEGVREARLNPAPVTERR